MTLGKPACMLRSGSYGTLERSVRGRYKRSDDNGDKDACSVFRICPSDTRLSDEREFLRQRDV